MVKDDKGAGVGRGVVIAENGVAAAGFLRYHRQCAMVKSVGAPKMARPKIPHLMGGAGMMVSKSNKNRSSSNNTSSHGRSSSPDRIPEPR